MPQLVNHGKQTVPAALRRDLWRPHFAIHFPENDAGKAAGMEAYRRLREFSLRRQLDPPQEELMTTQEDVDKAVRKSGSPLVLRLRYSDQSAIKRRRQLRLPLLGQKLPLQLRARKLMNQKASSVADASFVLNMAMEHLTKLYKTHHTSKHMLHAKTNGLLKTLGKRARRRLKAVRRDEEEKAVEIADRAALAGKVDMAQGTLPINKTIANQLSMEFGGSIEGPSNRILDPKPLKNDYNAACEIQINWADLRDGTYAETWPDGVFHGEIQPLATSKGSRLRVIQHGYIDGDGVTVSEQKQREQIVTGSSVHVHGAEKPSGFYTFQEVIAAQSANRREEQVAKSRAEDVVIRKKRFRDLHQKQAALEERAIRAEELHQKVVLGGEISQADEALVADRETMHAELAKIEEQHIFNEEQWPDEANEIRNLVSFRSVVSSLRLIKDQQREVRQTAQRLSDAEKGGADPSPEALGTTQQSPERTEVAVSPAMLKAQQRLEKMQQQMRAIEQSDPAVVAAAQRFLLTSTRSLSGHEASKEEAAALAEIALVRQTPEPGVVLPDENKGVWSRIKGWVGR